MNHPDEKSNTQITVCAGCGAALQTTDSGEPGYIPEAALARTPAICQRCYRIKHYNEVSRIAIDQAEFLRILGKIAGENCLVVHIVDLFDFEGSLIAGLHRFIGQNPILLVANKADLLPKGINPNRIVNWLQRQTKLAGLKTDGIVLTSAKSGAGFARAVEAIAELRRGRDVYVVGATNVGKSTLLNRLIRNHSDLDAELTVSRYPGTTLDLIKIPLDDGKAVVDTPGIVYNHRLSELAAAEDLPFLMPDKPIKPLVFQLNPEQTLFFGAFARFDFLRGERKPFTLFVANALPVHRTKLTNADDLFRRHRGVMLSPPPLARLDELPPFTVQRFKVRGGQDLSISGLGWIKVSGESGAEVQIHVPKGVKVAIRDSLV
ncbi:MAG TPA: ribosome biogenesis GTPase YqeH [Bacilli bacterium]